MILQWPRNCFACALCFRCLSKCVSKFLFYFNYWFNFLVIYFSPEHKLFIGMLPKNVADAEVSMLFSKYGNIKDLQILRGSQQTSKGALSFSIPIASSCSPNMDSELNVCMVITYAWI